MKIRVLFGVFVLLLFSVSGASAWTNTGGGDHGGEDWTPSDASTIAGEHYNIGTFTVTTGYTIDISTGSTLYIYADTINIVGTLNGVGKGSAGGAGRSGSLLNGYSGSGAGAGGGGQDGYSEVDTCTGSGGGGAGYGGIGAVGQSSCRPGGSAGSTYGVSSDNETHLGSGGGSGGTGWGGSCASGAGGRGGGVVFLSAANLNVTGTIDVSGASGGTGGGGYPCGGGGGGGSGGTILLRGIDVAVSGTLNSIGGTGGNGGGPGTPDGGAGGGGRIKVFYTSTLDTSGITTSVIAGTGYGTGGAGSYHTEEIVNAVPTVPTITTPINEEVYPTKPVYMNVNSTDADGDTIWYYFYGDKTDGTTLINVSTDGTYTWDIEDYGVYYWKVYASDVLNNSANTSLQQFTLLVPIDLYSPTNDSTLEYSFPPLLHDITFTWQNTSAPSYKYQIAKDSGFSLISEEGTIGINTTTASLEADDYFWRVYAYDITLTEYSNVSETWQFTVTATSGAGPVTAIDGVVYEITTAGSVAVDGALVNIWNTTWSDSMLVGQNGYYYFDGAKDGTYSVRATKTGYTDGSIELVTVQALNTTTRNILLQSYTGAGREYVTHYVLFTVKTLWGTLYSGVDVNVYLGDAVIALYTGTTGTDGSVGFELVESNEYRLTFIDASQGINEEIIIYPVKSEYPVYIYDTLAPDDEDIESEEVTVSVTTAEINDTHAYINVTYTDGMNETTDLNIYINQSDETDPFNQTVITYANLGATSSITHSFIIDDYPGQAYFINVGATHTTFGDIQRTYSVRFDGMLEDYGYSKIWVWIGVGGMMFVAGMFKASKAEQGALVVCVVGWVFVTMGFFDSLGSQAVTSMAAGLGLATVLAVGANMSKKDRDETV